MNTQIPKSIKANINNFTGRTWLLADLLQWLDQSTDRTMLLTGGPGTGKSMIIAWLAGYGPSPADSAAAAQLDRIRSNYAAIFCQAGAMSSINPRVIARNIACQLGEKIPEFFNALMASPEKRVDITVNQTVGKVTDSNVYAVKIDSIDFGNQSEEESFDRYFISPIKQLYESGYNEKILLLFDALDEAQVYTGNKKLAELLSQLNDLPDQVRILASTRLDERVLMYFRTTPRRDLITDAPANVNVNDIFAYVDKRLESEFSLDAGQRNDLARKIGEAAKGVFLYAQMVLDDLKLHPADTSNLTNYPLPEGLCRLYHESLQYKLGGGDQWGNIYKKLLGLVAVAREYGITKTQLENILGEDDLEQPLRTCMQYLAGDFPDGPFKIFDRSFADFLLDNHDNVDFRIDGPKMHRDIADYYLRTYRPNWSNCDSYGLTHIIEHILASNIEKQERKDAFQSIMTGNFIDAVQERTGWLYAFIQSLEVLANEEPDLAAETCFSLILERTSNTPNSVVIQRALRLLVNNRLPGETSGGETSPRIKGLAKIVRILRDKDNDKAGRLLENLKIEMGKQDKKDNKLCCMIVLALAETRDTKVTPQLLELVNYKFWDVGWAAADALIALNDRSVIPDLIQRYQELPDRTDDTRKDYWNNLQKQLILYILGWMHAEEAKALKPLARSSMDPKVLGREIELTWLLEPAEGDPVYLNDKLRRILASPSGQPEMLGAWSDEWLQKRLVRALMRMRVEGAFDNLKLLETHIRNRPEPKPAKRGKNRAEIKKEKRRRLLDAVEEAITELQVGR